MSILDGTLSYIYSVYKPRVSSDAQERPAVVRAALLLVCSSGTALAWAMALSGHGFQGTGQELLPQAFRCSHPKPEKSLAWIDVRRVLGLFHLVA